MRFILFVEGYTEKESMAPFLKRYLDEKLSVKVGIKTVRFDGWHEMVKDMPKKTRMYLEGPDRNDIIAVIGLLDLYGPTFYPNNITTTDERLNWAKECLEKNVGQNRFKMFFAVHEVEAWLLSQTEVFPKEVGQELVSESKRPEEVNFDDPPSKRLERIYLQKTGRKYKKRVYGSQLFSNLVPEIAANKCPELKKMLEWMLEMAKKAVV